MTFEGALREALDELGLDPAADQVDQLVAHYELLVRWNRRINLTRITDPTEAARRHFGEAAFLHKELPKMASAVDVGSGGGFPGLPFAVLRPQAAVTLVESTRKKAAFLSEAARNLPNVSVCSCRIADWGGSAEWALLRGVNAVGILPDLEGAVGNVALLGSDRPPSGAFGGWRDFPTPWSDRRRLWIGAGGAS